MYHASLYTCIGDVILLKEETASLQKEPDALNTRADEEKSVLQLYEDEPKELHDRRERVYYSLLPSGEQSIMTKIAS